MNKRIYKYQFIIDGKFSIDLPIGYKILSCQIQHSVPCMWVLINPEAETKPVGFRIFGTGHEIDENVEENHITTFQDDNGFVWHLFIDK